MRRVLHALRVKGLARPDDLAVATGLGVDEVVRALGAAEDEGLVVQRTGRLSGWSLTPGGRARHQELFADELDDVGRDRVAAAYRRFLGLNAAVLSACTDWQVRDVGGARVLNDHEDPDYDAAVLTRLEALHDEGMAVCHALADALPRFEPYRSRLAHAVERVRAGDGDWVAKPGIDSYHTVWFELHEDLLSTLGVERSKEEPS